MFEQGRGVAGLRSITPVCSWETQRDHVTCLRPHSLGAQSFRVKKDRFWGCFWVCQHPPLGFWGVWAHISPSLPS